MVDKFKSFYCIEKGELEELRQILHDFAITYPVESKEGRQNHIASIMNYIKKTAVEIDEEKIKDRLDASPSILTACGDAEGMIKHLNCKKCGADTELVIKEIAQSLLSLMAGKNEEETSDKD
jgi:uncharacterized protein YpuA (DUF1002 family)